MLPIVRVSTVADAMMGPCKPHLASVDMGHDTDVAVLVQGPLALVCSTIGGFWGLAHQFMHHAGKTLLRLTTNSSAGQPLHALGAAGAAAGLQGISGSAHCC